MEEVRLESVVRRLPISAECEWYGTLYCSGDIIIDLYSWKFLKKCQNGKMGIYGRTWQEVAADPRFEVSLTCKEGVV